MATTQRTPPPNLTTSEQSIDPVSTSASTDGTELRVPTTSEAATDQPILSSSRSTNIGLITGIVIIVIVVIAAAVTVVVIIAVLFKRHGNNMVLNKKRALSNPTYSIKGQCNIITTTCT